MLASCDRNPEIFQTRIFLHLIVLKLMILLCWLIFKSYSKIIRLPTTTTEFTKAFYPIEFTLTTKFFFFCACQVSFHLCPLTYSVMFILWESPLASLLFGSSLFYCYVIYRIKYREGKINVRWHTFSSYKTGCCMFSSGFFNSLYKRSALKMKKQNVCIKADFLFYIDWQSK